MGARLAKAVAALPRLTLAGRIGLLAGVLTVSLGLAAPVALLHGGGGEMLAAALAAFTCFAVGVLALLICKLFDHPDIAAYGVLGGMFVRMAIPLGLTAAVILRGGPLAEFGYQYYILVFYMIALFAEIVMIVPALAGNQTK